MPSSEDRDDISRPEVGEGELEAPSPTGSLRDRPVIEMPTWATLVVWLLNWPFWHQWRFYEDLPWMRLVLMPSLLLAMGVIIRLTVYAACRGCQSRLAPEEIEATTCRECGATWRNLRTTPPARSVIRSWVR